MENIKPITINGVTFTNEEELHNYLIENGYLQPPKKNEIKDKLINNLNFKVKDIDINERGEELNVTIEHDEFKKLGSIYGYIGEDTMFGGGFDNVDQFINVLNRFNNYTYKVVNKFSDKGIKVEPYDWTFSDIDNYDTIHFRTYNGGSFNYYFNDENLDVFADLLSGKSIIAKRGNTEATQEAFSEDTLVIDGISVLDLIPFGQKVEIRLINK